MYTYVLYFCVKRKLWVDNDKGWSKSCLKGWGDQIKEIKERDSTIKTSCFKKTVQKKATSIVLIFLNKVLLPLVVSEVFFLFTQITISSSLSSTSLFTVIRFCHTRFSIYSNDICSSNETPTRHVLNSHCILNIVSRLWQLAMFKILLKRAFNF